MNSTNHHEEFEQLVAYFDGELPEAEAQRVRTHLATCVRCRQTEEEMREVSGRLHGWTVEPVPATLRAPVPSRTRAIPRWLPIAAALVIAVGGGLTWLEQSASPPRPAEMAIGEAPAKQGEARAVHDASAPGAVAGRTTSGRSIERKSGHFAAAIGERSAQVSVSGAPLLARTARLTIATDRFDASRAEIDDVVRRVGGFTGRILVTGTPEQGRSLTATLQVPSARLDEAITGLKAIGRVTAEGVDAEDVAQQSMNLDARLENARNSEKRLTAILASRTGDLEDVLAVEREIARVREDIEVMDAQRKALDRRITYASVELQLIEETRAAVDLGPQPLADRFVDEFVRGWDGVLRAAVGIGLVAARVTPVLIILGLLVGPWLLRRKGRLTTSA